MTTFALVHGGWHGAWCWEAVVPRIEAEGHNAVTMDLPCDDPAADFDAYADVVCGALDERDDDVVVVGHSLGGLTIPLVAVRRPVRHFIYLCALLPAIGRSWFDQVVEESDMMCPGWNAALGDPDEYGRTTWDDPQLTTDLLYGDCDEAVAASAVARVRPQTGLGAVPFPLAEFPSGRCTYVLCTDDRMVSSQWARRAARDRLGADIVELPGGHSPFFSRPSKLVEVLVSVAGRPEA
jgi:pimeloyl-ACP methyl ester carboxylesterase